jgi:hypothetical protein
MHLKYEFNKISAREDVYITSSISCFTLVSCLNYFSTLQMEAKCYSEISGGFQQTTRHYIQENIILPL